METTSKNKIFYWTIGLVILALVLLFLFNDCKGETVVVETKEVKGKFEAVKPINNPILNTPKSGELENPNTSNNSSSSTSAKNAQVQKLIDSLRNRNIQLEIAFAKSKNKDSLYLKAIELNSFSQTFEDEFLKTDVSGISRGTVESLKLDYTIKSRKETVKVPVTVFRLISGIEVGMTKDLSKTNIKVNIGIQNKRGSIISASVDSGQRIYIGYAFSVFSLKH